MTNMSDDEFYRASVLYTVSNLEDFISMMKRSGQVDLGYTWVHVVGLVETFQFIARSDI